MWEYDTTNPSQKLFAFHDPSKDLKSTAALVIGTHTADGYFLIQRAWTNPSQRRQGLMSQLYITLNSYVPRKQNNPEQALLTGRKGDAKRRGIEFTLTIDDIIIPKVCPVLGIPIITDNGPRTDNSPSIDRIDNSQGYTPENSVVVSWRANMLKKDASLHELQLLAKFYGDPKCLAEKRKK